MGNIELKEIEPKDFKKINEELKKYSIKLWDRPQIVVANKCDMLYDESVYENFEKAVKEMGYDKVFKMSAATSQGIESVMQEASKLLKEIPLTDLEIADDERFIPEEKRFTYTINEVEEELLNTFKSLDKKQKKIYKYTFKNTLCSYDEYCLYEGKWVNEL